MRNLNDIEAKSILLLTAVENFIQQNPFEIQQSTTEMILAASSLRSAFDTEDAALGKDLEALLQRTRASSIIRF